MNQEITLKLDDYIIERFRTIRHRRPGLPGKNQPGPAGPHPATRFSTQTQAEKIAAQDW